MGLRPDPKLEQGKSVQHSKAKPSTASQIQPLLSRHKFKSQTAQASPSK